MPRRSRLRAAPLALLLALPPLPAAAFVGARAPGTPLEPSVGPAAPGPLAYRPLADGTVLLLFGERGRVIHRDGSRVLSAVTLRGPGFSPGYLVDLLPAEDGSYVILDAAAGTLWVADARGRVHTRRGTFVHPTRMERGEDGALYVEDPGVDGVVVLDPRAGVPRVHRGPGVTPFATAAGELVALHRDPESGAATLALLPPPGFDPAGPAGEASLPLGEVTPASGMELLEARVVGVHAGAVHVLALSAPPGRGSPEVAEVLRVPVASDAAPTRRRVPVPRALCMDCGPDMRISPAGELWLREVEDARYRFLRAPEGGHR